MTLRSLGLALMLASLTFACERKMAPVEGADDEMEAAATTPADEAEDEAKAKKEPKPERDGEPDTKSTSTSTSTSKSEAPTAEPPQNEKEPANEEDAPAEKDDRPANPEDIAACFTECKADPACSQKCFGDFDLGKLPF